MGKFKIGDKVRVREWDDMAKEFGLSRYGNIKTPGSCYFDRCMREWCGKTLTIKTVSASGYNVKETGWCWTDYMFENPSYAVIIYSEGNKVIALDKATGKKAEAICNPKDEFDFYFGADLAFERLMNGDVPKEKKPEVKYYTGEIFCTDSTTPFFTKGKIYKVNDGLVHDNSGTFYISKKAKSFGEIFSTIKRATFIEVKK